MPAAGIELSMGFSTPEIGRIDTVTWPWFKRIPNMGHILKGDTCVHHFGVSVGEMYQNPPLKTQVNKKKLEEKYPKQNLDIYIYIYIFFSASLQPFHSWVSHDYLT